MKEDSFHFFRLFTGLPYWIILAEHYSLPKNRKITPLQICIVLYWHKIYTFYIFIIVSISRLFCFSWLIISAFGALTLLVWRQEGHPVCKNWVVRCWHGYLSGARYKWFAYGPADATATPSSIAPENLEWFTFLVPAYPGCPGIKAIKQMWWWWWSWS